MTKGNEDTLSLRVAGSGTKRPKYGRLVPAAPQYLLMPLVIVHNPIHDNRMFAKRAFHLYTFSGSFAIAYIVSMSDKKMRLHVCSLDQMS